MSATPWAEPGGDPIGDLREARRLLALGAPPTFGDSTAAASLYLAGEGAGVAQALGVPVTVTDLLGYGDVLEDRTTGELRLIVGRANPPSDHDLRLAEVRRDAVRVTLRVLRGYGDPERAHRRRKEVDFEEAFDRIRRPTVRAAEELAR